jgi:plasmid maintenance system killer protein
MKFTMIHSFADRETERVWSGSRSRRRPEDVQRIGLRKLLYLNRAITIADLREPSAYPRAASTKSSLVNVLLLPTLICAWRVITKFQKDYS